MMRASKEVAAFAPALSQTRIYPGQITDRAGSTLGVVDSVLMSPSAHPCVTDIGPNPSGPRPGSTPSPPARPPRLAACWV
jgi:hypothetical protein